MDSVSDISTLERRHVALLDEDLDVRFNSEEWQPRILESMRAQTRNLLSYQPEEGWIEARNGGVDPVSNGQEL